MRSTCTRTLVLDIQGQTALTKTTEDFYSREFVPYAGYDRKMHCPTPHRSPSRLIVVSRTFAVFHHFSRYPECVMPWGVEDDHRRRSTSLT